MSRKTILCHSVEIEFSHGLQEFRTGQASQPLALLAFRCRPIAVHTLWCFDGQNDNRSRYKIMTCQPIRQAAFAFALATSGICMSVDLSSATEMFLFESSNSKVIVLDPEGTRLPATPGGWKKVGSLGEFSRFLDDTRLEQLQNNGFLFFDEAKPRSKNAEDWQPMPRGSFYLTKNALEHVKASYKAERQDGTRHILAFSFGSVGVKDKNTTEWRDLGMRLTLGGFPEEDIPAAAIEYVEGVPLLFLFDPKTLPNPRPTKIDFGPKGFVFAD